MILALDPGRKGAVAFTLSAYSDAGLFSLGGHDLVQLYLRFQAISHLAPLDERRFAFIEENTGFIAGKPRTGQSMFVFGRFTGRAEMALASLNFEIHRVRPRQWQKAIGAPTRRFSETPHAFKGRLCTFAREISPGLNARITRDNADALLILRYGINVLDGTIKPDTTITTTTHK